MAIPSELAVRADGRPRDIEVRLGVDGFMRRGNDRFLGLSKLAAAALPTVSVFELSHPADIPLTLESLANLTLGEVPVLWESRIVDRDGGVHNITWAGGPAVDGEIEIHGCDVTRERLVRSRLVHDDDWLRESLFVAKAGAWRYDVAADRLHCDPTFLELFQITDSPPEHWVDLARLMHVSDRARFIRARDDLVTTGRLHADFELRYYGGSPRYVAMRMRISNDNPSQPVAIGAVWDVTATKELEAELYDLAMRDQLSGLANRRSFERAVEVEWARARRHHTTLGFVMIDVDDFKRVNDESGHPAGDRALRKLAEIVQASARRPTDVGARYGGDEFVVLLPDTDADGAARVATTIVLDCRESDDPAFTVSAGSSASTPADQSPWSVVRRADDACLKAKHLGKNRSALLA
jgi:diguanylate cyclase (GGDEF)-like protein